MSAESPAAPAPMRLFTRQSTGLVRDVSPLSSVVFAVLTAPFPWVLALAIFWTYGAYPGGNLYIAYGIAYFVGLMAAIGIGMLGTTMPRSGGDYILVGRTINPVIGLISSFWFTANVLVSIAFIVESLIVAALAPDRLEGVEGGAAVALHQPVAEAEDPGLLGRRPLHGQLAQVVRPAEDVGAAMEDVGDLVPVPPAEPVADGVGGEEGGRPPG